MGKTMRWVASLTVLAGIIGVLAAFPVAAAEHGGKEHAGGGMGGARHTLSLTKDYTPSPWTNEVGWSNRAVSKLGFGAKNLLLGWTDIITETSEATSGGENALKGLGIGLKDGLQNTLGGAVHLVTFPITCLDAPLPEGGVSLGEK